MYITSNRSEALQTAVDAALNALEAQSVTLEIHLMETTCLSEI